MPNDPRIKDQFVDRCRGEPRDGLWVEALESGAIPVAFTQDREPTQACLRALEREQFEERPVVVLGDAPLFIVIYDGFRRPRPTASKRCEGDSFTRAGSTRTR